MTDLCLNEKCIVSEVDKGIICNKIDLELVLRADSGTLEEEWHTCIQADYMMGLAAVFDLYTAIETARLMLAMTGLEIDKKWLDRRIKEIRKGIRDSDRFCVDNFHVSMCYQRIAAVMAFPEHLVSVSYLRQIPRSLYLFYGSGSQRRIADEIRKMPCPSVNTIVVNRARLKHDP